MRIPPTIRTSRQLPGATWAVIAVLALGACSPSASASSPIEESAEPPAESAGASGAASAAASPSEAVTGDTRVTISGRSFGNDFTISAGSSVTFVNNDGFGHTATNGVDGVAAADALFDFSLSPGASSDPIVFDTPGAYQVTCKIHPSMNLTITVQ